MLKSLLATAALASLAAASFAQESGSIPATTTFTKNYVIIGAGAAVAPRYSGSSAYVASAIPVIAAQQEVGPNQTVYFQGLQAGYNYELSDRLTLGAFGQYRGERESDKDSNLTGMPNIDAAFEVGPKARLQISPQWGVEGQVAFDVTDAHKGYLARVGTDYRHEVTEQLSLTTSAGLSYGSEKYNNTYYGVTPAQARPNRAASQPDAGFNAVDLGVAAAYQLTSNWALQANLGADVLVGDVADSSIVQENVQPNLLVGVAYRF
jgi:outer membrane protein